MGADFVRWRIPLKPAALSDRILSSLSQLRRSESKVAHFVLNNATEVINYRIVDLAKATEVSEPTVVRFCKAIGCRSYQQFKLELAQQIAASPSLGNVAVNQDDSLARSSHKVFDSTVDALLKTRDAIDIEVLEHAVTLLEQAHRVHVFGFGGSAAVAADAQHKLFRLNRSATAYSDPHLQLMAAGAMSEQDVVVAISQSGRTLALIGSIEAARERGAKIISIGPTGSAIARVSDAAIEIDIEEGIEMYTPLSSRIAHLVVIDVLAIGLAQRIGSEASEHLYKMHQRLQALKQ
jgi:RpiR family carbohydrate utilization transcriptional regulator